MGERRKLVQAISDTTKASVAEQEFVYAGKKHAPSVASTTTVVQTVQRAPLTTRMRLDYAKALKRVSLHRQLEGIAPNTLQDIMEDAVEAWLRSNGELPSD